MLDPLLFYFLERARLSQNGYGSVWFLRFLSQTCCKVSPHLQPQGGKNAKMHFCIFALFLPPSFYL
jgi:hypothetical protein